MARIEAGILSHVTGTIGNVVGVSRKGKNYLRLKTTKVNNPQTEAQMAQRGRFGLIMQFMKPLADVTKVGFRNNPEGKSPYNYACSQAMKSAVVGIYPDQAIDYSAVLISEGELDQFSGLRAELTAGVLQFSWVHTGSGCFGGWSDDDRALLVVYNLTRKRVGYSFGDAVRSSLSGQIAIPDYFAGDTLLVYAAFVSADGSAVSTSQYAGSFEVGSAVQL